MKVIATLENDEKFKEFKQRSEKELDLYKERAKFLQKQADKLTEDLNCAKDIFWNEVKSYYKDKLPSDYSNDKYEMEIAGNALIIKERRDSLLDLMKHLNGE